MKKILSAVLVITMLFALSVPAFAANGSVNITSASVTKDTLTVEGTVTNGSNDSNDSNVTVAVVVQILSDNKILAMESLRADAGTFSGKIDISSLSLTAGSSYTVRIADYDGGAWVSKTVTIPADSTPPTTPTTPSTPDSGVGGTSGTTTTNPDGSTTTTVTDKATGAVTETTKNTDGSTTVVETKKDGTVTETVKTVDGTTGTVVTDKTGIVTEVKASISATAVKEAGKADVAVTLPVEVPSIKTTAEAPAVQITMPKSAGGVKVEVPVETVTPGTVAVLVKADGIEEIVKATTMGKDGVVLPLADSATVKIVDNSKTFVDTASVNAWAGDAVSYVTAREIFNGTGTTTPVFSPEATMTRGMLMTVLARYEGADTTGGANWYEKGMDWAKANGVSDGSNPNGNITREQLVVMLHRYANSPVSNYAPDFPDVGNVSDYAVDAMRWAVEIGLINGMNGNLNPQGSATRAQVAAIMMRFCERKA